MVNYVPTAVSYFNDVITFHLQYLHEYQCSAILNLVYDSYNIAFAFWIILINQLIAFDHILQSE